MELRNDNSKQKIKMEKDLAENWMKQLDIVDKKLVQQAPKMTRGIFLNKFYETKRMK